MYILSTDTKKILDSRLGNDFEADKIGKILLSKRWMYTKYILWWNEKPW
jgi:hypothetical protein